MKRGIVILIFIYSFVSTVSSQNVEYVDFFSVNFNEVELYKLNNNWEFYPQKLYYPSDFKNNVVSDTPLIVSVPHKWTNDYKDITYGTYRIGLILPNNTTNLKLYFTKIRSACEIWVNQELYYKAGTVDASEKNHAPALNKFSELFFTSVNLSSNRNLDIVIRVSDFTNYRSSGIMESIYIGEAKTVYEKKNSSSFKGYVIIGLFLMIAIYQFLIFLFRKKEKQALFFSIMSISIAIRTMFNFYILEDIVSNYMFFWKINFLSIVLFIFSLTLFFYYLYKDEFHKAVLYVVIVVVTLLTVLALLPPYFSDKYDILFPITFVLIVLYILFYVIPRASKNKKRAVFWGGLGVFVMLLTSVVDYLKLYQFLSIEYISSYGFVLFAILQSINVSYRLSKSLEKNEKLTNNLKFQNDNLESLVQERTNIVENQKNELLKNNNELKLVTERFKAQQEEYKATSEEFQIMAKKLWEANIELEKLSTVASHTDNSILIFDSQQKLEWVNNSFIETYSMPFDKVIEVVDLNYYISNQELNEIISSKQSKQIQTISKLKPNIWLQTTITPIYLSDKLYKIVAIETNISKLKNAEAKISEQNKHISSSINYASTIQKSILPEISYMSKYLNIFVYYKPKETVGGDFYWFYKSKTEEDTFFIAVSDCTGHGVAGALMSMIGSTLLYEIVKHKKIYSPKEILKELRISIKSILQQTSVDKIEGMDVALCKINTNTKNVVFSGAKRPLFVYYADKNEVIRYRGNLIQIGGNFNYDPSVLKNIEFSLNKNDVIYLTSDGFIDQNKRTRKRIGTQRFIKILTICAPKPIDEQYAFLDNYLYKWKGNEPQRDDITVVGIKF